MKINFLLPSPPPYPIGGCKVVYEYANHLAKNGHCVNVDHALSIFPSTTPLRFSYAVLKSVFTNLSMRRRIPWFHFAPRVRLRCIPRATSRFLSHADATIATAWCTSSWVAQAPHSIRGEGFYLIQHVEDWDAPRETILETWKLPLHKVVISHWLEDTAKGLGEESTYIPNGLDFEEFGIDIAPEKRDPFRVGMLWHRLPWKGSAIGLEALREVHETYPMLHLDLFGVDPAPAGLPEWVTYTQNPSRPELRALYNRCAIFVTPSFAEGWALPPAEAMQCGCALVATAIGGHADYAIEGKTALTASPQDPASIRDAVANLFGSPDKRLQIAQEGNSWIHQYTWERATSSLESLLQAEFMYR